MTLSGGDKYTQKQLLVSAIIRPLHMSLRLLRRPAWLRSGRPVSVLRPGAPSVGTARVLGGLRGLASAKHSPPPSEHYNEPEGNLFGRIVIRAFEPQLSTTLIWQSDHATAIREASITHPTGRSASTSSFIWAVWPSLPSSTNTSPTQSKTFIPISSSKPKFYSTAQRPGPGARRSGGWRSAVSIWNRTDTNCQRSTSQTIILAAGYSHINCP